MNPKRYRARTMREALEKVKSELGENALVLGSRQVRNRGFLGIGASEFVEVSASAYIVPKAKDEVSAKPSKPAKPANFNILGLNSEELTTPVSQPAVERPGGFSALAARAYTAEA